MGSKLLIASNNQKKIKEIKEILGDFFDEFVTFSDYNLDSPEENGDTFSQNSLIKAKFGCDNTNLVTLADDSGLCVPFLNGEPGIYSSRYACEGDDLKNYVKLLDKLKDVPDKKREAYFISVIVMVFPDGKTLTSEGRVYGNITKEPRGENGFGYDPIFFLDEFKATMAELSSNDKNNISHRAIALKKMREKLGGVISEDSCNK